MIIVIGGGAAGMIAAYAAAKNGSKVILLEKNEKLGKKLFITGKGRCNITNAADLDQLFANVMSNRKFLYSAFNSFHNEQMIDLLESYGLRTKVERGNRVFPVSDHSSDVINCLAKALKSVGVEIHLHTCVKELIYEPLKDLQEETGKKLQTERVTGVELTDGRKLKAEAVIVATGGFSYQSTGSTGDGYRFARESGHKIVEYTPSLVPFEIRESWVRELMGLSLKNTAITIYRDKKKLYEDFGEMLFTHFGVSGPMILSASGHLRPKEYANQLQLVIDLKPALTAEELDKRILRDFDEMKNRQFGNALGKLLPTKLEPVIVRLSGIDPQKQVNEISKAERAALVDLIKHLKMTITGTRGWNEAIITKGGVSVKDVNPSTMESKLVRNLYFCGEVLDLDALTGGYNLQIAWSTGHLAGSSASTAE